MDRNELCLRLISIGYERNDIALERTKFRIRCDTVDIIPSNSAETAIRVEFFGDEIDRVSAIDIVTGAVKQYLNYCAIFPATHYVIDEDKKRSCPR